MHVKRITGTVTSTVVLGEGNYGDKLTITPTGVVDPSALGSTGVYAPIDLSSALVRNHGLVEGGIGGAGSGLDGGIAIDLASSGAVTNPGSIKGGYGGYGHLPGVSYGGGGGVLLQQIGAISNLGSISGGAGSFVYSQRSGGKDAGFEVDMESNGTLANKGFIGGGTGGTAYDTQGKGGDAVDAVGGTITNSGVIIAGQGGGSYAYGGQGASGGIGVTLNCNRNLGE